jgi:putative membrane protein
MFWHMGGMGVWGPLMMGLNSLLFIGVVIAVIVLVWHLVGRPAGTGPNEAERILQQRFARGEIDHEEYRRRLAALRPGGV